MGILDKLFKPDEDEKNSMKLRYLCLIVIVLCILATGNAVASCFANDCHGESSDAPCPHTYDHNAVSESECAACHQSKDYPNCDYLADMDDADDSSSSEGGSISSIADLSEIADMELVKVSAVDVWNSFEERYGIGTLIITILLLVVAAGAVIMVLVGTAKTIFGSASSDSNDTKAGKDIIKNTLLALAVLVGSLFFIVLMIKML